MSRCLSRVCHWPVSGCCPKLSRAVQRAVRVLRIMFAIGQCQGVVRSFPGLSSVLSGCSGSCLPLGCVSLQSRCCAGVLCRVLRIMFAIVLSQGAAGVLLGVFPIIFDIGVSKVLCRLLEYCLGCCPGCCHVSHLAVSGCRAGGSSRFSLGLGCVSVLSRVLCKGQGKQSGPRIQRFSFHLGSGVI